MHRLTAVMSNTQTYERYPVWIPVASWTLALSIDVLGAVILFRLSNVLPVFYVVFLMWVEYRVLKYSCVNCYYCGKMCGLGRGKLAGFVFKRPDPEKFARTGVAWKDLVPDLLVLVLPLAGGIILLMRDFDWLTLGMVGSLVVLGLPGNGLVRGKLVCKYCKQREIGCPAEKLFSKQCGTEGHGE